MSVPGTKDFAVELYTNQLSGKLAITDINTDLLHKIVSKLAPISYDTESDSAYVSGNDQTEIETVRISLFTKHLGLNSVDDSEETAATKKETQTAMIKAAIEKYGSSNPKKYRVPLIYIILEDNSLTEDYLAL